MFTIREINIDSSYVKLQNPLRLYVNKRIIDGELKVSSMQLISDAGNRSLTDTDIVLEGVNLEDGTTTTVRAKLDSSNVITLTIPNKIAIASIPKNIPSEIKTDPIFTAITAAEKQCLTGPKIA